MSSQEMLKEAAHQAEVERDWFHNLALELQELATMMETSPENVGARPLLQMSDKLKGEATAHLQQLRRAVNEQWRLD
jgi:hypothetical protein